MMSDEIKTIRYCGDMRFAEAVLPRLQKAGFSLTDAADADLTLTYFLSLTALEDAFFEDAGLMQVAKPGNYLVDLSPSTPAFSRELHAVSTVNDIKFIESPIVVKDIVRSDALDDPTNLVCFTAGERDDVEAASKVLAALAATREHFGTAGSAQLARSATALTGLAAVSSVIEAFALCKVAHTSTEELPVQFLRRALESQSVVDQKTQCLLTMLEDKNYSGQFSVHMWAAEIAASVMAADDIELILPSTEATLQLLELLIVIGGADLNPDALSLIYGEEAACAEQGLDWTRAEHAYESMGKEQEYEEGYDSGYPSGFDHYSSN